MDDISKEKALRKSIFMKKIIAYPNEILNELVIDDYTKSLKFETNQHLENVLRLNRFHFDYSLTGLFENTDLRLWTVLSDSTITNAYYYNINNAFGKN